MSSLNQVAGNPELSSRRNLLAGAVGALGALIAAAVGRPALVSAADGETVKVGGTYSATSATELRNLTNGDIVLSVTSNEYVGIHGSGGKYGVRGVSNNSTGVRGESSSSRGGSFKGPQAQIRLVPDDTQFTHPSSGKTGDLFVDANDRLWFCKGESDWVQLA